MKIRVSLIFALIAVSVGPSLLAQTTTFQNIVVAGSTNLATPAAVSGGCADLEAYGGSPTLSDNSSALTAALAASPGPSKCVYIPPGTFKFSANYAYTLPNNSSSIMLKGAGADVTQLVWANGDGLTFNYLSQTNSVHIREMSILTGANGTGSGITLNETASSIPNPANSAVSDIINVSLHGVDGYAASNYWANGIYIYGVSNVNFSGVSVTGHSQAATSGYGIYVQGSASLPPVVFNVTNSYFQWLVTGIVYGNYVQGMSVAQTQFTGDAYGIWTPSNLSGLDQLVVTGSQFNCTNEGVYEQTSVPNSMFDNNLFIVPNTGVGVMLNQSYLFSFLGNSFNINGSKGATYPVGIVINSSAGGGVITGNVFDNMVSGVILQSGATGTNVQSNRYSNTSNNVVNNGSGNTVGGGSE